MLYHGGDSIQAIFSGYCLHFNKRATPGCRNVIKYFIKFKYTKLHLMDNKPVLAGGIKNN